MKLIDIIIALSVVIAWGANYVAIRVGVAEFPPIFVMALRYLFVGVLLFPWLRTIKREQWRPLIWISIVFGILYFSLLFIGMQHVEAGEGSIIATIEVPVAAVIAYFAFGEKITWPIALGTIISIIGVMVTVGIPQSHAEFHYIMLVVIAAIVWAVANNQIRALGEIHPFALNGAIAVIVLPFYLAYAFWRHPDALHYLSTAGWAGYASLAYMIFISMIYGYSMWFFLLKRNPVNKVTPFILLMAPAAIVAGHFMLNEPIFKHTIIGAGICLVGLSLVVFKPKAPAIQTTEQTATKL